jgi:DNA-binding transcriptional LysR family regulator
LPSFLVGDDIREGRIIPILEEETTASTFAYAVYPESRHLSPKVRATID